MNSVPAGVRPLAIQLLPADGIGGVEVAARSMLEHDCPEISFEILLLAGQPLVTHPAIIAARHASSSDPRAHLAALRGLWRRRPDVLIASLWRSAPLAILYKLLRPRTRLVYFLHVDRTVHLLDRLVSGVAIRLADEVWSDAAATMDARGVPARKPRRVISFVLERFVGLSHRRSVPSFVAWCRILPQKGLDRGIALIAALCRAGVEARYDIWGPDDGEQATLEALATRLGIRDAVQFRGPLTRDELPAIAAEHSFYLQLSRFEGMAVATVEAMQLGLVPVVTPVGEMARYCRDGDNALVINPDELESAAARIATLLRDPPALARMARQATVQWEHQPLYRDDVCGAIRTLSGG